MRSDNRRKSGFDSENNSKWVIYRVALNVGDVVDYMTRQHKKFAFFISFIFLARFTQRNRPFKRERNLNFKLILISLLCFRNMKLFGLFALLGAAFSDAPARLVASKTTHTKILAQNVDITFNYKIFNIGPSAAVNVSSFLHQLPV